MNGESPQSSQSLAGTGVVDRYGMVTVSDGEEKQLRTQWYKFPLLS